MGARDRGFRDPRETVRLTGDLGGEGAYRLQRRRDELGVYNLQVQVTGDGNAVALWDEPGEDPVDNSYIRRLFFNDFQAGTGEWGDATALPLTTGQFMDPVLGVDQDGNAWRCG